MNQIKFGTDGWRGIMNDTDFTPENVGIFTQGTLNYLKDTIPKNNLLIVGYDTYRMIRSKYDWKKLDMVKVKGKSNMVSIYTI